MKIKRFAVAVISAVALLNPGVARADWVYVTSSNNTQFFIDDGAVEKRGSTVFYWGKIVFAMPQRDSIKSITAYSSIDCQNRVARTYELVGYTTAGQTLFNEELSEQHSLIEKINLGTQGENIYQTICHN